MLLSFTFENYLSFDGLTELSMVAGPSNRHANHITQKNGSRILNTAVIYGANAAGKSSLVDAMHVSKRIILGDDIHYLSKDYCRCNPANKNRPSTFQYIFTYNDRTFQFGFETVLSEGKFVSEWLYEIGIGSTRTLYTAQHLDGVYRYDFPTSDDVYRTTLNEISESLKDCRSKLLITELSGRKFKEELPGLEVFHEIHTWFKEKLWINRFNDEISEWDLDMVSGYLARYGTDIVSMGYKLEKINPDETQESIKKQPEEETVYLNDFKLVYVKGTVKEYRVRTTHASCGGSFLFSEESTGTRKIAELCATLFDGARDRTLVFDGFGTSMHPLVVEKMVKDYLETSAETLGQFIITTYDTGILSPDIFRKDEIWFIDKKQGCSELYSLEEFESDARIDSHLQRAYLEGRFGAIPICTGPENHGTDRLSLPAHPVPKDVKRSVAK